MARTDISETAAKRTSGKRLAAYWIGGFFAVGLAADTAVRLFNPEGYAKLQADRERQLALSTKQAEADEDEAKTADAEKRVRGEHCISAWDGSNRSLKDMIKSAARNPDSFEHIDTRIGAAVASDKTGRLEHPVVMRFRSQNGFGGMNVGVAVASVDNETCNATLVDVSER